MTNSKNTVVASELFSELNLIMSEVYMSLVYTLTKDINIYVESLPELIEEVLPENYNDTEIQECYGVHTMTISQYVSTLYVLFNQNQISPDKVYIFHVEIDGEVLALYLCFEAGRWFHGLYEWNFGRKWFVGNIFVYVP